MRVPAVLQAAQVLSWECPRSDQYVVCALIALFHTFSRLFLMSVPGVLQAALVLSRESSVCRLYTGGSHSHVLVLVSDARACCLAGCSGLELGVISMSSVH